jgi:hypothetical protein
MPAPGYLSLLEQQRITTLHRQWYGVRAIAQHLGQAPSTVSLELRHSLCARRGMPLGGFSPRVRPGHRAGKQRRAVALTRMPTCPANGRSRSWHRLAHETLSEAGLIIRCYLQALAPDPCIDIGE